MPLHNPESAGGSASSVVKIDADIADKTTIAVADAAGLLFAVTSGVLYRFAFKVVFQSGVSTTGIKFGLTTPTFTRYAATVRIPFAIDGTGAEFAGPLAVSGDAVVSTAVETINTDYVAIIEGIILPSADGSVQLRYGPEVDATAVRIRSGSMVVYDAVT